MARNRDELPRWVQIIIAAVIIGVVIYVLVPKPIIWVALGVAIAILAVVAYLAYKRQGIAAFTSFAKRAYNWLIGTQRPSEARSPKIVSLTPLSPDETSLLIDAVGSACENPHCRSQLNLEVHHIKRRAEGGTHSVWNLIVLCHGCHGNADRGAWSRSLLKRWTERHSRERNGLLRSGKWKYR
ncbi:MAG: HNH endonuclease [Dehalococcoidia bacterium]